MHNGRTLARLTVPTELYQVEPLQNYIGFLARRCRVPENKRLQLDILIEEAFTHIVSHAFGGKSNGEVDIAVRRTPRAFVLSFHYMGLPFGYSLERADDEGDEISLQLIRSLSSSCSMRQEGRKGQTLELCIDVETELFEMLKGSAAPGGEEKEIEKAEPASEETTLREIRDDEMEMLVQCLYQVFGYTYAGDYLYSPEEMRARRAAGNYRGFVAINSEGKVVAHVGMLKGRADDCICESGQAFVSPRYGKRGLFRSLKQLLIDEAEKAGLCGVFSSSIASHPYSQLANLKLNCVEAGLELGYIPAQLKTSVSGISGERQSVMNFFRATALQHRQAIYVPARHRDMVSRTYVHLGVERDILEGDARLDAGDEASQVDMVVKIEWSQVHLSIKAAGGDLQRRMETILRQAMVSGAAMCYVPVSLASPRAPGILRVLESLGFFYAGVMPYELEGADALRMQLVLSGTVSPGNVATASAWGEEIKKYVFDCKDEAERLWKTE